MPTTAELAKIFAAVRDAIPTSGTDAKYEKWKQVCEWIVRNRDYQEAQAVLDTFSLSVASNDAHQVVLKLNSNRNQQVYAIIKSLRGRGGKEARAWELFEMAISPNAVKLRPHVLTCSFLLATPRSSRIARLSSINGRFQTYPSTSFEKMLFIICLTTAGSYGARKRGEPVEKKTKVLHHWKSNTLMSQKIGYAVQKVVRAWDTLARYLQFRSVEEMLSPYILFEATQLKFKAISSREKGFAPTQQSSSLLGEMIATTDPRSCCPIAFVRTRSLDENLRRLAKDFLEDLETLTLNDHLYRMDVDEKWDGLDRFIKFSGRLHVRFENYDNELFQLIREEMPELEIELPDDKPEEVSQATRGLSLSQSTPGSGSQAGTATPEGLCCQCALPRGRRVIIELDD